MSEASLSDQDLQVEVLRGLIDTFADLRAPGDDAGCVDLLDVLERVKSAAAGVQARLTDALDRRRAGSGGRRDASLGAEVGLARRESPHRGRRQLELSRALLRDLPHTYAALCRGDLSERRAEIIAGETSHLSRELRLLVDVEVAGDADLLEGLGDVRLTQAVRRVVLRVDEESALARRARAQASRRVTGRLLPDGMAQVTAYVTDWQYAAVLASLGEEADRARVAGDGRTRGQLLADTVVERLTGATTATRVPVALKVVMSAESLLGADCTPAYVPGCGHVPADVARGLVAAAPEVRSTVQRLFHFPATGALVALERDSERFPAALRQFIATRDQTCRTPWCNAPIRHTDHALRRARGGATSAANGQGLCESCNYAKELPGWRHRPEGGPWDPHTVEVTTPTGHRHRSTAPPPPVPKRRRPRVDVQRPRFSLVA